MLMVLLFEKNNVDTIRRESHVFVPKKSSTLTGCERKTKEI